MARPVQSSHHQRRVGAAHCDITPDDSQFLYGYPLVERMSTGVHDPLLASAMFLEDDVTQAVFIAVDVIALTKQQVATIRTRIEAATQVPARHIMVTATHTHSGPVTMSMMSNADDDVVPPPDPRYLRRLVAGIIDAATEAWRTAQPADVGLAVADASGVGTNRHDPSGPRLPETPVLAARARETGALIGIMWVCAMHPTVLHEDSTLISGDFPAAARHRLQALFSGESVVCLHHMGAAGNQSPRHVVLENTFAEADRLGEILASAVTQTVAELHFDSHWNLQVESDSLSLPLREFPSLAEAERLVEQKQQRFAALRNDGAQPATVRTAECDLFGAAETRTLAVASVSGMLAKVAEQCLPAELQLIGVNSWYFVGWPGEVFVEYAIELRRHYETAFPITLANGDLQGYLVTEMAVRDNAYEASNAIFESPASPQLILDKTLEMLMRVRRE